MLDLQTRKLLKVGEFLPSTNNTLDNNNITELCVILLKRAACKVGKNRYKKSAGGQKRNHLIQKFNNYKILAEKRAIDSCKSNLVANCDSQC